MRSFAKTFFFSLLMVIAGAFVISALVAAANASSAQAAPPTIQKPLTAPERSRMDPTSTRMITWNYARMSAGRAG